MKEPEKPTIEKLEELEKQVKDKFTLKLISLLKEDLQKGNKELYNQFSFQRILGLVRQELNVKKIKEFVSKKHNKTAYGLKIIKKSGKIKRTTLNGGFTLEEISQHIQKEFNLESMHLYEFKIGEYKYGPECDEWREMFDSLDDVKLGAAISVANLKIGDTFNFLYDFGDSIKFKIQITSKQHLDIP